MNPEEKTACPSCGHTLSSANGQSLCLACVFDDALEAPESVASDGLGSLGDFILQEEIARGGMGLVYRARQLSTEREVAVKMLSGLALISEEARIRFRLEARAMAALDHPHLLPIYGSGESEGAAWLAMKLARGGTLGERRTQYHGQWRAIAELLATAAEAVHHAHSRGVLHRDLKPANLLFDEADCLYVADFGLAKLAESDTQLTQPLSVMGTPHYLAPEAVDNAAAADTSADQWSLGVILYELLAKRLPFEGESTLAILRSLSENSLPPLDPSIPRDLRVITQKCLQRDPHQRYPSAADLADDLRRWTRDEPISARAESLTEQWARRARRNPLAATLAAMLTLSLIGGAIALWRSNQKLTDSLASSQAARTAAQESRDLMRLNLYAADLASAQKSSQNSNRIHTAELLSQYLPTKENPTDLRTFPWDWLDFMTRGEARQEWHGHQGQINFLHCPPGGPLTSLGTDGTLRQWETATGHSSVLLSLPALVAPRRAHRCRDGSYLIGTHEGLWQWHPDQKTTPNQITPHGSVWWAFSPDDRWVASATKAFGMQEIFPTFLRPLAGGPEIELPDSGNSGIFSPDSTTFISGDKNGLFHRWSGEHFQTRGEPLEGIDSRCFGLAFSPAGNLLAAGFSSGWACLWEWPSGRRLWQKEIFPDKGTWSPVFSADGHFLLFSGSNQTVALTRTTDGTVVRSLHGHTSEVHAAVFSPDGKKIISTARDGAIYQWDSALNEPPRPDPPLCADHPVFHPTSRYLAGSVGRQRIGIYETSTWQEIASIPMAQEWPLAFSADGAQLITGRRHHSLRHWDWRTGQLRREVHLQNPPDEGGGCFIISPDQRWVVGGTLGGLVIVWDATTGQRLHGLKGYFGDPALVQHVAFSPDSRWLVSTGNDRQPRLWRVADWSLAHVLPFHQHYCYHASFSLDGQTLATSCYDGHIRLFDCATGQLQHTLRGDTTAPNDVIFLRDEKTIAFLQGDKSVLLIDTRTWRETVRLPPPPSVIKSAWNYNFLTLSPDGHLLIATDYEAKLSAEWRTR